LIDFSFTVKLALRSIALLFTFMGNHIFNGVVASKHLLNLATEGSPGGLELQYRDEAGPKFSTRVGLGLWVKKILHYFYPFESKTHRSQPGHPLIPKGFQQTFQ